MQLDTGTFQLSERLYEVSGIRPQSGMISGDHKVSGLSGKACQKFHLLPSCCRIFAAVWIRPAEDDSVPAVPVHQSPEGLDSLGMNVYHMYMLSLFSESE